jgi:fucose permease
LNLRIKLSQYMGFITIGLVSSIIGPMLSAISLDIQMSYSQAGLVLSGQFLGMLLTVLLGGYLADKYGNKLFLLTGGTILSLGLLGSVFSQTYLTLFVWTIVSGIGFGTYEVGINSLCSDQADSNKGRELNFLHFFFGFGAILGPILVTICLRVFDNWRFVYCIAAIFPIIVSIMLWPLLIKPKAPEPSIKRKLPYKDSLIWISCLLIFIYVGIEVSIYGWIPQYWEKLSTQPIIPASLVSTVFWVALTLGRLISGRIVDRMGFSKFIATVSFGTLALTLVWTFTSYPLIILIIILLIGFLLSGLFPTIIASSTSNYAGISGRIVAFLSVFSSLGGFLIPSAIGKSADVIGIIKLPLIIFGLTLLLFIVAVVRMKLGNKDSLE